MGASTLVSNQTFVAETQSPMEPPLLTIIIPVYNEERSVEALLKKVIAAPYQKQIIVVDDGSTDRTNEILTNWEGAPDVCLLQHSRNRGKGAAIRTGLEEACGLFTIIQDADLEYDPQDYPRLIEPLRKHECLVVFGSRYLPSQEFNRGRWRLLDWGVGLLNMAVRLLYGTRITDEATCYKAMSTGLLQSLDLQCERFEFCPEVTAKISRMGISIREVPIRYDSRSVKEGKKIRWTDGFEALQTLWRWRKWSPQPGHRAAVKESIMKSNNPRASVPGSPAPTGWKAFVKRTLRSRVGRSILRVAGCIPLGRAMFNMVYDPQTGFHAGTGDMQRDWDDRARSNAQYFIAVDGAGNDGEFWESGVRELNQLILPGLELSPDMKALEIGCGIGRLARPLSRIVQEVHGVDISAEMVHRGMECLSGIPNVQLHHTTGDLKMFADASFDMCYSYRVFQHIPRKELVWQYWNEVARVLKPGGLFRFQICLSGRSNRRPRGGTWFGALPTAEELQSVLPASGFEILSIQDEPSSNERLWDSKIITCRCHSHSQEASRISIESP